MSQVVPERVRERMEALGISQSELARRVGIKQPSINRILSGEVQNPRFLHLIARELETTPEYLTAATNDPQLADGAFLSPGRDYRGPPAAEPDEVLANLGLVPVKEIDLALGAGGTYIGDGAVSVTVRYFPRQWLREFTDAPPEMLAFARVRGTSMKPTLVDGAILIIDLRRKRIDEQDELWWIVVAEIGMVKRIWANPDGSYKIKSDNPNVGPETAHDEEMYAVGRVVASIGKH